MLYHSNYLHMRTYSCFTPFKNHFIPVVLVLAWVLGGAEANAQLSGTYSISPSQPASAGNFQTFTAAVDTLKKHGVSGPVVFNIATGVYTEKLVIPGIPGASATNGITFRSDQLHADSVVLRYNVGTDTAVVTLDSAGYISFRFITVATLDPGKGRAFQLTTTALCDSIDHCIIRAGNAGIYARGLTGGRNVISNNDISTGTHGIYLYGVSNSVLSDSNIVSGNTVRASAGNACEFWYTRNLKVRNNQVSALGSNVNTIYSLFSHHAQEITGNTLISSGTGATGIYVLYALGTQAYPALIANNVISNDHTGIYCFNGNYVRMYHNSVRSGSVGIHALELTNGDFRNNIIHVSGAGAYAMGIEDAATNIIDYNLYYQAEGKSPVYGYDNFAAWQGASGQDLHTVIGKAHFVSATDLHLGAGCNKGIYLAPVDRDKDGNLRGNPPEIGAYEFTGMNNIAVDAIVQPAGSVSAGLQDLVVRVKNTGTNAVTSFDLTYVLNNGSPVSRSWTGSLAACDTVLVTFTGAEQVNLLPENLLVLYTAQPNAVADTYMGNDTLRAALNTPLNGTYSIGGPGARFATFNEAVDALAAGISGPVVFNVHTGTYTEQLLIPAIPGASAANTVRFTSAAENADSVVLRYEVDYSAAVVRLSNAQHVSFRHITVAAIDATRGIGFELVGTASYDSIAHCLIKAGQAGILAGNFTGGHNVFTHNTIRGGGTGIDLQGVSQTVYTDSNIISYNHITDVLYYGCYLSYTRSNTISHNTIITPGDYGIYANYNYDATRIIANTIRASGAYGVYLYNTNATAAMPALIANNSIIGRDYGMRNYYGSHQQFYHNTIRGNTGIYVSYNNAGYSDNEWLNNIITSSGTGNAARISNSGTNNTWNHNLYFTKGANVFYNSATAFITWQTTDRQDTSSIVTDPFFSGETDLRLTSGCKLGTNLPAITTDLEGHARSSSPTVGAYEYTGENNIGVVGIVLPGNGTLSAGYQDMEVKVRNTGTNVITSFNVSYVLNNTAEIRGTWIGTLAPCDTVSFIFTGSQQINLGGINNLRVYTDAPNWLTDISPLNDTLATMLYTPLSGNYTIGGAGADFPSFAAAVNTLIAAGGVSGPVVFNVNAGTYEERVEIPAIPGTSRVNTVTFDGGAGNAASRVIAFNGASATRATVQISSSSYIGLKNLTIRTTGATYGWGVHISGTGSNACQIKNCVIDITGSGTTSTNAANFNGIVISNSATATTTGLRADSLEIDSNLIRYGAYGIVHVATAAQAALSNRFRNNIIENSYTSGIHLSYHDNAEISGNTVTLRSGNTASRAIYVLNCTSTGNNHTRITGNRIFNTGQYAISLSGSSNTGSRNGLVANNVIGRVFQNVAAFGIHLATSDHWNIYHNTVNKNKAGSTGANQGCLTIASGSNIAVYNNLFAVSASGQAVPVHIAATAVIDSMDYNLLYNANNPDNLVFAGGATFNSSNFRGGAGFNLHSIAEVPSFVHDTDLHITKGCNNGVVIAGISRDADDSLRNAPPDMGAYEYSGTDNIAIDKIVSPVFPVSSGLQDLVVRVSNSGSNPVSSFNISYRLNNGPVVSQPWSGFLAPCDTVLVTFTGPDQLDLGNTNTLTVYTDLPNGFDDSSRENDTLSVRLNTPLNGVYTIGHSGADFTSFSQAAGALASGGVSGPVTFNVQTGTYTERVVLTTITGASPVNTITFRSAALHADSVVLQYNVTATAPVVKLDNASYVSFKYLTVTSNDNTNGRAFELAGASSSDSIVHCRISAGDAGIYGKPVTGGRNVFSHNHISGTANGILFHGTSANVVTDSNVVSGNTITARLFGVSFLNTSNLKVRDNSITGGNMGVQSQYAYDRHEITGNRITSTDQYGMFLQYDFGGFGKPGLIANNTVISNGVGVYSFFSGGQKFYHNSIRAAGNGIEVAYEFIQDTLNEWKNNIITSIDTTAAHVWSARFSNTFDYNLYHTGGNTLIATGGLTPAIFSSLPAWQAATRHDSNSVWYRPPFTGALNLAPDLTDTAAWVINGSGIHLDSALLPLAQDINGNPRAWNRAGGVPDIGAYELTPAVLPPLARAVPEIIAPYPVSDTIQVFLFERDTVARIRWYANSDIPKVSVRRYTGVMPQGISPNQNYMYFYTSIDTVGSPGWFAYDIDVYYKNTWLGTNPAEADVRLSKRDQSSPWQLPVGSTLTVDPERNILSATYLTGFSEFSGTDVNDPMPVHLLSFSGERSGRAVVLAWTTASEVNNKGFEVQRSADGKRFETIGFVKGNGTSNITHRYAFTDDGTNPEQLVFYRLKQEDFNRAASYSNIIRIDALRQPASGVRYTLYPNPFDHELLLGITAHEASMASIEVYDLAGKKMLAESRMLQEGINTISLHEAGSLAKGVYFVTITVNGEKQTAKVIRQ